MSIDAVKGVEIGDGFAAAELYGEDNADEMRVDDGKPPFLTNHAGGILGGIRPVSRSWRVSRSSQPPRS